MTYLPRLGISNRHQPIRIAEPAKQGSPHHWKFPKVKTALRFAEVIRNLENDHVHSMEKREAKHKKKII
jgi:hypothetical protein